MTMKNIPITIGFAVITASQFALGTCMIVLAAEMGGKVRLFDRRSHSQISFFTTAVPHSSTAARDTPRRIPLMRICSAS